MHHKVHKVLWIFLWISAGVLQAQDFEEEIALLKVHLSSSNNDAERQATLLNEISFAYRRIDVDSTEHYAQLALELALSQKDIRNQAYAHKNMGIALYKKGEDYVETLGSVQKSLDLGVQIADYGLQAACLNNMGLIYQSMYRLETSLKFFFEGLEFFTTGMVPEGQFLQGLLLSNIGSTYMKLKRYQAARDFFELTFVFAENHDQPRLKSIYCDEFAEVLLAIGEKHKALEHCNTCLDITSEMGDRHSHLQAMIMLASIHYELGDFVKSEQVAIASERLAGDNNFGGMLAEALHYRALSLDRLGRNEEALVKAHDAYQESTSRNRHVHSAQVASLLSKLYEKEGDLAKALDFQRAYHKWSVVDQDQLTKNQAAEFEAKYQNESQLRENDVLAQENVLKRKQANLYLVALAMVLPMLFYSLFLYNSKRKLSKELKQKNRALKQSESSIGRQNEDLQKYIDSNIQLEQFAHLASHDLRAPIITIRSFADLLDQKLNGKISKDEKKYLSLIQRSSRQMLDLVTDLLDYSKINSQQLSISKVDINEIIEEVFELSRGEADELSVQLLAVEKLPTLSGDPIKLKRVFQNLIGNAIKFSDADKDSYVQVAFERKQKEWIFGVKDNGIGIVESKVDIFQPYKQLHRKAEFGGSGLGLSTCKKIIEQHGGRISYVSIPGKETTFYFSLPMQPILPHRKELKSQPTLQTVASMTT